MHSRSTAEGRALLGQNFSSVLSGSCVEILVDMNSADRDTQQPYEGVVHARVSSLEPGGDIYVVFARVLLMERQEKNHTICGNAWLISGSYAISGSTSLNSCESCQTVHSAAMGSCRVALDHGRVLRVPDSGQRRASRRLIWPDTRSFG